MMDKPRKLTKRDFKRILSKDMYINAKKKKRSKGDMLRAVNTRLSNDNYKDLMQLLSRIKVERSAFIRYAIQKLSNEIHEAIEMEEVRQLEIFKEKSKSNLSK
ncbi:MAG: hypothetical protein GY810_16710 [Aureispira sp.]|nr:hypothetical protein [Aureispira sp.]